MGSKKTRMIFLENLPRRSNKECDKISWKKSVGHKVRFIYTDIEGEVTIESYNPKGQLLTISYNDNILDIVTGNFIKCKIGKLLKIVTIDFKIDIGTFFCDKKRDIVIIDREYRNRERNNCRIEKQKWYKYKCNKCGWNEGWIEEQHLLQGSKCSCCDGKTVVEGINDIPTTAPWMVKYFQGGYEEAKLYTVKSDKKIHPICPDCKQIKNKAIKVKDIYRCKAIGCDCGGNISYPNKMIHYILNQMDNTYNFESLIFEYYPNWVNRKFYDAYFKYDGCEYIVEMDGRLGHGNSAWGTSVADYESLKIDKYKDDKAKENNIEVIRIDCRYRNVEHRFEYIKSNLLKSKLCELFDLSYINWIECEKYCCNNLCKEACMLRKKYNLTFSEISEKLFISEMTASRYIKTGIKLGWC